MTVAALTTLVSVLLFAFNLDQVGLIAGVVPARLSGMIEVAPAVPAWLTPLSATLIHGGLVHLAVNLLVLVYVGVQVERVYGGASTLLAYVVGAYGAAAAQWLSSPDSNVAMVGASGAISALFGIYSLAFANPKPLTASPGINRAINALWMLAAWVVIQIASSYLAYQQQGIMVATAAHVGGFIVGMVIQRPLLLWRYRSA